MQLVMVREINTMKRDKNVFDFLDELLETQVISPSHHILLTSVINGEYAANGIIE
jgi:hypothetical protein